MKVSAEHFRRRALVAMMRDHASLARIWPGLPLDGTGPWALTSLQQAELSEAEREFFTAASPPVRSAPEFWIRRAKLVVCARRDALLRELPPVWQRLLVWSEDEMRHALAEVGFALLAGQVSAGARTDLVVLCAELGQHSFRLLAHVRNAAALAVVRPWVSEIARVREVSRQRGEPAARWPYLLGRTALATAFHALTPAQRDDMLRASCERLIPTSLPELLAALSPLLAGERAASQADWVLSQLAAWSSAAAPEPMP